MPSAPEVKSAKPVLFVTGVENSAAYFRDKLGFTIDFLHGEPPFYGAVSRGGACIHLRGVCEPVFMESVREEEQLMAAFVEVANVKGLFTEYKAAGANFVHPLRQEPWGGSTFTVRDLDGNAICFAQPG